MCTDVPCANVGLYPGLQNRRRQAEALGDCRPIGALTKIASGCTHCYFNAFERVHDQQPKCPVEYVKVEYVIEGNSVTEGMIRSTLLERNGVRRESVVSNVAKVPTGLVRIWNLDAPSSESVDEFVDSHWRFVVEERSARPERSTHRPHVPVAKKIPQVRIVERCGRCCASNVARADSCSIGARSELLIQLVMMRLVRSQSILPMG